MLGESALLSICQVAPREFDSDILTLFPQMFQSPFSVGILKRAIDDKLVGINIHNIRDYTHDKHHTVDDYAYGGGAGMVLKPEPIFETVESIKSDIKQGVAMLPIILLTPQGRLFSQEIAHELSRCSCLILICGHYEGVDERVREHLVTDEISIGDYVLSGGELAAKWRREQAILRTLERRPELLDKANLCLEERELVARLSTSKQRGDYF